MNSTDQKKIYLLDTNVLIGFALWLPISLNNVFWLRLAESLKDKDWVLLDAVVKEIKYNEALTNWCKEQDRKGLMAVLSDAHKARGVEINNQYKMIDDITQKSTVDTYLIAYAEANGLAVFSRESPRKNDSELYKIPDVCGLLKVPRISKPEAFMQAIGFKN